MTIALLVAALGTANGWEIYDTSPYVWLDFPIEQAPPVGEAPGLQPGETAAAIDSARSVWMGHACAQNIVFTSGTPYDGPHTFDFGDGLNAISLDDPDDILEPGVLSATLVQRFGVAMVYQGLPLQEAVQADMAVNDLTDWGPGGNDLSTVLAHDYGHVLGFDHSDVPGSVMVATGAYDQSSLHPDDIDGLVALYGAGGLGMECSPWVGRPPVQVDCEVTAAASGVDAPSGSWTFGDDSTASGTSASHTFAEPGAHEVEVCVDLGSCGSWCDTQLVVACPAPVPAIKVQGTPDPLVVNLLNDTAIAAAECFRDVRWEVLDAEGTLVFSSALWEPVAVLPEPGRYTARLTIDDILDASEQIEVEFDTSDTQTKLGDPQGCGCTTSNPTGSLTALALVALLGLRRERYSASR